MTSVAAVPPLPVSAAPLSPLLGSTSAAATQATVTLDGAAGALAALATPGGITGTVSPGPTDGMLALVTSLGTFAIASSSITLPVGAQLTIQGQAGQPGTVALVAIDDVPAAPAPPSVANPLPAASPSPPPTLLDLGTRVTATVIAALAPSSPLAPASDAAALPVATLSATIATPIVLGSAAAVTATPTGAAPAAVAAPPSALAPGASTPSPAIGSATLTQAVSVAGASVLAASPGPARGAAEPAAQGVSPDTIRIAAALPSTPSGARSSDHESAAAAGQLPTAASASTAGVPIASSPALPAAQLTGVARLLASILGPATTTAPAEPALQALPVGASLTLRVAAVQAAMAPTGPDRQGAAAPASIEGVIRATATAGATLDTAIGLLRLVPTPNLPTGTRVAVHLIPSEPATATLTVVADEPPGPAPAPTTTPETNAAASPSASSPAAGVPPGAPGSAGTTSPGGPVYRVFIAADATAPASARENAVIGTVIASPELTPSAASLVETPLGLLAVTPHLGVPAGTLLLLELPDALPTPGLLAPVRPGGFENNWSALQATLTTLGHAVPNLATHLRTDLSIQSGDRLAASLLLLVAGLRGEAAGAWPGEAIERALTLAGRTDLKLRLGQEFAEVSRIAADPATGQWQVFLLPIVDGEGVRPIRLYLKRKGERNRRAASDENARFVLEFELRQLGAIQLDGFVRPRRFDLMLRSHAPLGAELQAGIEHIFHERIAAAELVGAIEFATVSRFEIAPLDPLRQHVGLAV